MASRRRRTGRMKPRPTRPDSVTPRPQGGTLLPSPPNDAAYLRAWNATQAVGSAENLRQGDSAPGAPGVRPGDASPRGSRSGPIHRSAAHCLSTRARVLYLLGREPEACDDLGGAAAYTDELIRLRAVPARPLSVTTKVRSDCESASPVT